jgi:hypothetical protein
MNKKLHILFVIALFIINHPNYCQYHFPFNNENDKSSILAYWYNCKFDSVTIPALNATGYFNSSLQVYGPMVADSFQVRVEAFISDSVLAYSNTFNIKKNSSIKETDYKVDYVNGHFRIMSSVNMLKSVPEMIKVNIFSTGITLEKRIVPKYHKIYGHITDFNDSPLKSFILVKPDAFEDAYGIWSDGKGYYEIELPERVYNAFYVNDGNYKSTTLEAWSWHMIIDNEQQLDYKIGTGEVYNLHVWPNNGGYNSLFVSFRPMVLGDKDSLHTNQIINNKDFNLVDISPKLDIRDFNITINGEEAEIFSLQEYFETGKDIAMPAYLIQIKRLNPTFGKQTICVEYNKSVVRNGKKVIQNSMGYFQFYTNYSGMFAF